MRNRKSLAITIIVLIFLAIGIYIALFFGGAFEADLEDEANLNDEIQIEYTEPPEDTQPEIPTETPLTDEQWNEILQEVLDAVLNLSGFGQDFSTNYGFLFNDTTQEFVTLESLVAQGALGSDFLEYHIYIFYLRQADIEYDSESTDFYVFLGYQTIEGVGFVSTAGEAFMFREDLYALLLYYQPYNGEIIMPGADDSVYQLLLAEGITDIRYLAYDEANVLVVFLDNSENIVFLVRAVDFLGASVQWGLGNSINPIPTIQMLTPSFNRELLPMQVDYFSMQNPLINDNIALNSILTQIYDEYGIYEHIFASKTENLAYIVFENHEFLFNRTTNEITQVENWQQAREIILNTATAENLLIVWQR